MLLATFTPQIAADGALREAGFVALGDELGFRTAKVAFATLHRTIVIFVRAFAFIGRATAAFTGFGSRFCSGFAIAVVVFTDRADRFGACLRDQENGATLVTERFAHLIAQILVVSIGEELVPVHEEQERGRSLVKAEPCANGTDGLQALNSIMQRAVQDGGRHLLPELGGDVTNGFQQAVQVETGLG